MGVATGTFVVDTTGSIVVPFDVPPKAILLWTTFLDPEEGILDSVARVQSIGFAGIEGGEFSVYMNAQPHPSLPTTWLQSSRIHSNEILTGLLTIDTWMDSAIEFNAIVGGPYLVHFMVFGGESVRAYAGSFGIPASGASVSVEDVPFDLTAEGAKFVLLATASLGGLSETDWGAMSFGAVAGEALDQWAVYNWTAEQGSTQGGYTDLVNSILMFDAGGGLSDGVAAVSAWTALGFDVAISDNPPGPGDTQVLYVAVFADHPEAFAQAGGYEKSDGDQTVATPDTPQAVLAASAIWDAEEDDQVNLCVGGADELSQHCATALSYGGTTRVLVEQSTLNHLSFFKPFAPDYTVDARVSAFDPTDFVEDWDVEEDTDGIGTPAWGYLAVKLDPDDLSMLPMGGT